MAHDLIDDLRHRLLALMPEAAPALAQVIPQVRHHWGGTEPYIRKRDPQQQAAALAGALRQGQPLREAFATAGLSRRTGFRYLNKPSR
jgi:hypothetical protein